MTAFLGVLYLLVFLAAGCTCVRFLLPRKSLLTRVWLGVSLGLLLMMWLPALIAFAVDFTWTAHLLALIPLAGLTAGCFFLRDPSPVKKWDAREKQLAGQMLMVVLPLTLLYCRIYAAGLVFQFGYNIAAALLRALALPEHLSTAALLDVLGTLTTREELVEECNKIVANRE